MKRIRGSRLIAFGPPFRVSSFILSVFLLISPALRAQNSASTPWTAAGKEFYSCFPSVVGSSDNDPTVAKFRSLFISSRAPARVTVEVLRTALDTTFIVTPGHYARVDIPIWDALNPNDDEVAVSKVAHIYSNEIITVYGYSHNALSSDGFLIYPTQSLGTAYYVMSTRNAVNYKVGHGGDPSLDTTAPNPRSEFAIVATQNNTTVSFTLTATSYSGLLRADSTYSIRLNRGQVYQLMARDTGTRLTTYLPDSSLNWWDGYAPWNGGPDCDLTGSYISSNKPIAVFSGHERAAAPTGLEYDFAGISRDHLVEEMMPVSAWGKNYIVASLGQDFRNGRRSGGDAIRILAAYDTTRVTVNGALAYTLSRGQHADFLSGNAAFIQSDKPIMVADFMQCSNTSIDVMGDPDLTLARPVEDYTNQYTLPPWTDASIFSEGHTLIICDSSTITTTLVGGAPLSGVVWNPITGTRFVAGIYNLPSPNATGEQRIESPLPCYAETYAYGVEDSYTFAGGGDYPYVDSLYAVNLDFHAVPVGEVRNQSSPLHSSKAAKDTVQVYNYEWVSGDTSNFVLVGGLNQSAEIAPGVQIPVPFQFHPTASRSYTARLRVWSDAVDAVFIALHGQGIQPKVVVIPDTIDFGRVRLGMRVDSLFTILNEGSDSVKLIDLDYGTSVHPDFYADSVKTVTRGYYLLPPQFDNTTTDSVHFAPTKLGLQTASIPIDWIDVASGDTNYTPVVYLRGTGVEPSIASTGFNFGSLRVDSSSVVDTISISNRGSDATTLDSVTIIDSTNGFILNLDTLPPGGPRKTVTIGYEGTDTALHFTVQFIPKTLGPKRLILRIHTLDAGVVFDTFLGAGVEPLVLVSPDTIDFGMITIQPSSNPLSARDTSFSVSNLGTMPGLLQSLIYDSTKHFTVLLNRPGDSLNEKLDTGSSLPGTIQFNIVEEGDFLDTVFLANDTRYGFYPNYRNYQPAIILKAKVRTGGIGPDSLDFGTITSCDPDTEGIAIHNPFPVELHIDSIAFLSDTAGFSLRNDIVPQISLPPDSSYILPLIFSFPPDSLNGLQVLKMGLFQRHQDGDKQIVDTVTVTLIRKQRTFTLHAHLPTFESSANDIADLKLPITVEGPRAGVTELNSWTLSLHFSNDLFEPVGIDTTNALAVRGDSTFTLTTHWDQATRTFTIIVTGSAVSDSAKIANDLLLSILLRAFLTTDTVVTVTPTFTWAQHPCAYNLQSFTLSIPYGDDCGDPTIRSFMRHDSPFFTLIGAWPNPVERSAGISIGYNMVEPSTITAQVFNEAGQQTGEMDADAPSGAGTLSLDAKLLPNSGAAFIRLVAVPVNGGLAVVKTVSVEVAK